jgi:hypothetical protein
MIDISSPADVIGRKVVYRPYPDGPLEEGVVTEVRISFESRQPIVFVRYGSNITAAATRPSDLDFMISE